MLSRRTLCVPLAEEGIASALPELVSGSERLAGNALPEMYEGEPLLGKERWQSRIGDIWLLAAVSALAELRGSYNYGAPAVE